MERGFLLLLGSIVALAIAAVGAQLNPGYQEGEHQLQRREPPRFEYLPGEGGRRRRTQRRKVGGGRPASRNGSAVPGAGGPPLPPPPALPQQFAGSFDGDSSAAPGEAGVDYPVHSHIPVTSFSCKGRIAGYYADPETQCQVFHVCTPGGSTSNSFICPNGTLFNPAVRTCDWWPAVDCGSSTESLRLNYVEKRVKDKSEATQSLLGGPGNRINSQRIHNRQQNQQFRQKFTNEILSHGTYQEADRQSINLDREQQQHSLEVTESLPTQPPYTTWRDVQNTQRTRQEYNADVVNSRRNTATRRRPLGSKRFNNQSLKRNQNLRTPTPPVFTDGLDTVEDTLISQTSTARTPTKQTFHWPPLSQTVTRFDITSETLDFPSFRNTPSTTTYRIPTTTKTEGSTLQKIKYSAPVRTLGSTSHGASFSVEDTFPRLHITSTKSPYIEEKEYQNTRINAQVPAINRPFNERFSKPQYLQEPFANSEPIRQSLSPEPTQTASEDPKTIVSTTPRSQHFSSIPKTSEQPLENSIFHTSPTYSTFAENERTIRPIVVTTPKPDVNTFGSQKTIKPLPSGFSPPQPILESFHPLTSDEAAEFQSNPVGDTSAPGAIQGFPSSIAASVAQSFAESNGGRGGFGVEDPGISQAFAQSGAFSADLQYSGGEDFSPFFAGQTGTDSLGFAGVNEHQNREMEESTLAPENTESGPFSSNVAHSFASADASVSDEGFKHTVPVSTTVRSSPPPKATTFRPLNLGTVKATFRPTTTTIKPVYTPTVPQTTARPTTQPAPKLVTTTTTARPTTTVSARSTSTIKESSTPSPVSSTTNSFKASTTTKKPKGFYITVAPPTNPSVAQQPLQKDEAPKDNSLSYPENTYLPKPTESPIFQTFSPSHFYPPTGPSYSKVDSSYFRSPINTQYSQIVAENLTPKLKTSDAISDSELVINPLEEPVKSTSFEIKIEPDNFNNSGSIFNPLTTYDFRPQYSFNYQSQPNFNQNNDTERQRPNSNQISQGTTEPPFVIQKSVELYAAHEVAYHPSVFQQTSYSLSSLQSDYNSGKDDQIDFQPPPYLEPSPNARGFGNWNVDEAKEKRVSEES